MAIQVVTIKRMAYRAEAAEEWSNRYALSGTAPTTSADWRTLFDALVAAEKTCYSSACEVVRGLAYDSDADDALSVWSVDLTVSPNTVVPGTLTVTSARRLPGDVAVWVRWKTSRRVNGKPVYLRKYFHDVWTASTGAANTADTPLAAQTTALAAFGNTMRTTGIDGGKVIRDQGGGTIEGHGVSAYTTTRTLKRRPKRVPTP